MKGNVNSKFNTFQSYVFVFNTIKFGNLLFKNFYFYIYSAKNGLKTIENLLECRNLKNGVNLRKITENN